MLFPGLLTSWVSLDVLDLAKDWPKWRQSFEILIVAACDEENLRDRQKLAIFLHCLGRDGRDIVNEWYPQLVNFNSVAAKETTFAQVWNRMNVYCQNLPAVPNQEQRELVKKQDQKELVDLSAQNQEKDEALVEELSDVEEALDSFKKELKETSGSSYLTLREMERFAMREPSMKAILKEFLKRGNLLIVDSFCCFFSWERRELFKSLIQDATNVKFQSKPANNFFAEFSGCFQNVTELTLSGFTVLNENLFNDLPGGLRKLHVDQSHVISLLWLTRSQNTLETIHLEKNSKTIDFPQHLPPGTVFRRLTSLTLIGEMDLGEFRIACPVLKNLHIDGYCFKRELHGNIPRNVSSLTIRGGYCGYYSHPGDKGYRTEYTCYLTLDQNQSTLRLLKNLEYLEILGEVDSRHSQHIESLNIKTVKVTYKPKD